MLTVVLDFQQKLNDFFDFDIFEWTLASKAWKRLP